MTVHTPGGFIVVPHWETTDTLTQYLIQSHYPDTVLTSHGPILLMQSARLGNDKYQFYKSLSLTRLGFKLPTFRTIWLPRLLKLGALTEAVVGSDKQDYQV